LKILFLTNKIPYPLDDGGAICTYGFIKTFHQLGNEVSLLSLNPVKHKTTTDEAARALHFTSFFIHHQINTSISAVKAAANLFQNTSYNIDRFYNTDFEKQLIKILQEHKFDIIQLEGLYLVPYLNTIRKYSSAIVALRAHNVEHEIWERLAKQAKNPFKKWYLKFLAKRLKYAEIAATKNMDIVIPITENDREFFQNYIKADAIHVSPAGIDLDRWQYTPTFKFYNWYHIGALDWRPNLDAVHYFKDVIYPEISTLSPKFKFHLAGKNMPSGLKNISDNQIVVYEKVKNAEEFIENLDVCIVPLKAGSGIRIKILEAMAAGKLVISSSIGIQGIVAEENVHFLLADCIEDYIQIFKKLENNELNIVKIIANARRLIEKQYSTEAVCMALSSFYKQRLP
jgi:glycosyltransferase involved in cell wall biosynthesis